MGNNRHVTQNSSGEKLQTLNILHFRLKHLYAAIVLNVFVGNLLYLLKQKLHKRTFEVSLDHIEQRRFCKSIIHFNLRGRN